MFPKKIIRKIKIIILSLSSLTLSFFIFEIVIIGLTVKFGYFALFPIFVLLYFIVYFLFFLYDKLDLDFLEIEKIKKKVIERKRINDIVFRKGFGVGFIFISVTGGPIFGEFLNRISGQRINTTISLLLSSFIFSLFWVSLYATVILGIKFIF